MSKLSDVIRCQILSEATCGIYPNQQHYCRISSGAINSAIDSIAAPSVEFLNGQSQLDAVIRRMHQILPRSQISFGRLYRRVAQKQLDLLKLAAGSAAHFRATAPPMPHAA